MKAKFIQWTGYNAGEINQIVCGVLEMQLPENTLSIRNENQELFMNFGDYIRIDESGLLETCSKELFERSLQSKSSPYVGDEEKIANLLTEAWGLFCGLETTHACHNKDFCDGIHKAQDVLIHRIVQRDHPDTFPTYDKEST